MLLFNGIYKKHNTACTYGHVSFLTTKWKFHIHEKRIGPADGNFQLFGGAKGCDALAKMERG